MTETTRKATATGVKYYGKYSDTVEYEYRGRKYEVEYGTMHYCCPPAWRQHKDAQEKIDAQIEKEAAEAKYRAEHPDWEQEIEARRKENDDFLDAFFAYLNRPEDEAEKEVEDYLPKAQ